MLIAGSAFLHCSSPACIRTMAPDIVITRNTFDELDDSDAVHGFRALGPGCGALRAVGRKAPA